MDLRGLKRRMRCEIRVRQCFGMNRTGHQGSAFVAIRPVYGREADDALFAAKKAPVQYCFADLINSLESLHLLPPLRGQ